MSRGNSRDIGVPHKQIHGGGRGMLLRHTGAEKVNTYVGASITSETMPWILVTGSGAHKVEQRLPVTL